MDELEARTPARDRILQAAYGLFLQQGFHGTSMRQVGRVARLTPAAIYNHFPNKETLFVELLSRTLPQRQLVRALEGAQGDTPEALVRDAYQRMGQAMTGQFDNLRLMFIELLEFQARHAPRLAEELLPGFLSFFERVLQTGARLMPIPPILFGRAFLGLFMSYAITRAFFADVAALGAGEGDLQTLADVLLHGILSPDPETTPVAASRISSRSTEG